MTRQRGKQLTEAACRELSGACVRKRAKGTHSGALGRDSFFSSIAPYPGGKKLQSLRNSIQIKGGRVKHLQMVSTPCPDVCPLTSKCSHGVGFIFKS